MKIVSKIQSALGEVFEHSLRQEFEQSSVKPECLLDLQTQLSEDNKTVCFVCFAAAGNEIRAWEHRALNENLLKNKIKTIGLFVPSNYCKSEIIIKDSLSLVQKEIAAFDKNADALICDHKDRFWAYTSALLPFFKNEIELQFTEFLESGGAILFARNRTLPLTSYMLRNLDIKDNDDCVFMCAHNNFTVSLWVTMKFKSDEHEFFCPITHEFGFSDNLNSASVNFLVSSILTKISKQYFFKLPQKALLLDNTNGDENSSSKQKILEELFSEKFPDVSVFNTHGQKGAYLLS